MHNTKRKEWRMPKLPRSDLMTVCALANRKLRDEWAGLSVRQCPYCPGPGESDDAAERRISGADVLVSRLNDDAATIRASKKSSKADREVMPDYSGLTFQPACGSCGTNTPTPAPCRTRWRPTSTQ